MKLVLKRLDVNISEIKNDCDCEIYQLLSKKKKKKDGRRQMVHPYK